MPNPDYQLLDHTADIGIELQAPTPQTLFEKAGQAFCDLICDWNTVQAKESRTLTVERPNYSELMQGFLDELLFLFETEHTLYPRVRVKAISPTFLEAEITGEKISSPHEVGALRGKPFAELTASESPEALIQVPVRLSGPEGGDASPLKTDPKRHEIKVGIKAVTRHQLFVKQEDRLWKARIIFDV